ncbi:MAG: hypothetical protein LBK01_00180 [Burkholderiaceae bacterium]|jgi:hypothetical protein|nr:hypothetical protein [Burkholderiaceae bacterium]
MDYVNFFSRQCEIALTEFENDPSDFVISQPLEFLEYQQDCFPWRIEPLRENSEKNAIVIQKPPPSYAPNSESVPELWVRRSYSRYRSAFALFLHKFHSFDLKPIPICWHIDHIEPVSRFQKDHPDYFIRLFLINGHINSCYGGGLEREFYKNEREKTPSGACADWVSILKCIGIEPPSKSIKEHGWAIWAWEQSTNFNGDKFISRIGVYTGILSMLNLYFTGCYNGSYKGLIVPKEIQEELSTYKGAEVFELIWLDE